MSLKRIWPLFACALVALLVMLPELMFGTSYSHSRVYNIVWSEQVVALVREGIAYPRWLPKAWDGLGAPTFYFYAPLFFLTTGYIGAAGSGLFSAGVAASFASMLFLIASGVGMWRWLRTLATERAAAIGGLIYMIAPYHLHDIYNRGALAESTAYASIPLVLLGLSRLAARQRGGLPLLATGYGLLVCGHLPVALLTSVTLIPVYALWRGWRDWPFLGRAILGGALGLGLSAIFLLPALGLLPHIAAEQLATAFYRPDRWFFFSGPHSIFAPARPDFVEFNIVTSFGWALVAVFGLLVRKSHPLLMLFGALGIALFLLVSGLIPWFWEIPGLSSVQFPSRLLVVTEFVGVTTLVLIWPQIGLVARTALALLAAFASFQAIDMAKDRMFMAATKGAWFHAEVTREYRDAPEYIPSGYRYNTDENGQAESAHLILPQGAEVEVGPTTRAEVIARDHDGGITLSVTAMTPDTIIVRRFIFPHWRVVDEATGQPVKLSEDPQKRVAWRVPSGVHRYHLEAGPAPFEAAGFIISLLSLVLIIAGLIHARRAGARA